MRNDVVKWAGLAGMVFAFTLLFQLTAERVSGVSLYSDEATKLVESISEHRMVFTLGASAGVIAAACSIPLAVGLFLAVTDEERPFALLACSFLVLSGVLLIVTYAMYGNLVGLAMEYVKTGIAPKDVIGQDADVLQDQVEIMQLAAVIAFGVSTALLGRLMLRSSLFSAGLGWLGIGVGFASLFLYILPPFIVIGRLAWLVGVGWTLWTRGGEALEPVPANA